MPARRRRKGLSSKVKRNSKLIKKLNASVETKAEEIADINSVDVNTTSAIHIINAVAQGLDDNDRIGNNIFGKSITLRGTLENDHGTPEDCLVRVIVFRMKIPNGATPTLIGSVLEALEIESLYNWDNRKQYEILFDNTWAMDTTQHSLIPFKIRVKVNKKINYILTTKAFGAAGTNGYYIGFFSNIAGTTNNPQITLRGRHTYEDS